MMNPYRSLTILIVYLEVFSVIGSGREDIERLLPQLDTVISCDTLISLRDFPVRIVKEQGKLKHFGFDLFTDEIKSSMDKELLESIETSLAYKALGIQDDYVTDIDIISGSISDFKSITHQTNHSISNIGAKVLSVEWEIGKHRTKIAMPISYQAAKGVSRSENERNFIDAVQNDKGNRIRPDDMSISDATPYADVFYVIPGSAYNNRNVTRNVYLDSESIISPIWDSEYPLESIANMFILADKKYGDQKVDVTVLKHEIGDKETFNASVNQLLAFCEKEGCLPFWGVEKFENGNLEGALFLYNRSQGYDHIFRISCYPKDVIDGNGEIKIRASLYVPTNNVNNLFAPYRKKNEEERIRYDK